jgi:hypothetical protein
LNFIEKNLKLKLGARKEKKQKRGNIKNFKCKMPKDRPDKEKSDKNKKKKKWKWNSDNKCSKNSQDKIKLNKWLSKNEE